MACGLRKVNGLIFGFLSDSKGIRGNSAVPEGILEKQFLVFCFGQHFLERNGFQFVSPVHKTGKIQFIDNIVRRFAFLESPSDQVSIFNLALPGISIEQVQGLRQIRLHFAVGTVEF